MSNEAQDISLLKLLAGVAGAFVSLRFIEGTKTEKGIMFVGGGALASLGATPTAEYLHMTNAEGLIGFLVGLFSMAIVSKIYEVIRAVDAYAVSKKFLDKFFPPSR